MAAPSNLPSARAVAERCFDKYRLESDPNCDLVLRSDLEALAEYFVGIPLSNRVMSVLKQLRDADCGEFVFPGQKPKKPLSNMAMEMVLRRMKIENATVHGFRSSFRDWAGNVTSFPREVTETALAHVIGDKAEQAYRRGDALDKRRALMDAWAAYCEPRTSGNVVGISTIKRRVPDSLSG
jgi:hypothetical protein